MKTLIVNYPALLGAVIAVVFCLIRTALVPQDRKRNDWFAAVVALIIPAWVSAQAIANFASTIRPIKYDLYIYQIDGLLGFQPSFAVGRFVESHPWLKIAASMTYSLLPMVVVLVFGAYLWGRPLTEVAPLVKTFGFNLALALPLYLLCP